MANKFKKTGKYVSCKTCAKSIYLMPYEVKNGRKKYCSKECLHNSESYTKLFQKGHKDLVSKEKRGHSEETRNKISKTLQSKEYSGDRSWNWKGGISKVDKLCRRMAEYFQWRSDVFTRDKWTCQTCQCKGYMTAHHIKGFSKIIKENNIKSIIDARKCSELWDINNGITLCEDCHSLTDNYKGRGKNRE